MVSFNRFFNSSNPAMLSNDISGQLSLDFDFFTGATCEISFSSLLLLLPFRSSTKSLKIDSKKSLSL